MTKPLTKKTFVENGVTVSQTDIYKLFRDLEGKLDDEILGHSLIAGGMLLRDFVRERLVKKMPVATRAVGREKDNITMETGIRAAKNKANSRQYTNVYILGNYLNRWFESGTDERRLKRNHKKDKKHHKTYKKGESRGKIRGLHFFRETLQSDMQKVCERIMSVINKELSKIFND